MQVSVTFRKIDASDTLRNYAEEKLNRIKKYVEDPIEAHVVLSVEKFRHIAEVSINANGLRINGQEETGDLYSAILTHRKSDGGTKPLVMKMNILAGESFEEAQKPKIIKTKQIHAKPMDIDEAVMQMDLANSEFLVFTNAKTRSINVIYRRKDGNFGLIEPES
jgi:putative sigma-54 modulation protein